MGSNLAPKYRLLPFQQIGFIGAKPPRFGGPSLFWSQWQYRFWTFLCVVCREVGLGEGRGSTELVGFVGWIGFIFGVVGVIAFRL